MYTADRILERMVLKFSFVSCSLFNKLKYTKKNLIVMYGSETWFLTSREYYRLGQSDRSQKLPLAFNLLRDQYTSSPPCPSLP
jgi:hypothetical protein